MRGALVGKQRLARRWAQQPHLSSLRDSIARRDPDRLHPASACARGPEQQMEPQVRALVERLHQTPHKAVIYATGGGSQVRLATLMPCWGDVPLGGFFGGMHALHCLL